ncbi:hypothetical protein [Alcanivorax sp.]|jgi:hypothetical protein|uniref:hypothetical protein n=1 Tax=Alcanivorax sp. TaxID=1872427 RepID=UPI0032D96A6D
MDATKSKAYKATAEFIEAQILLGTLNERSAIEARRAKIKYLVEHEGYSYPAGFFGNSSPKQKSYPKQKKGDSWLVKKLKIFWEWFGDLLGNATEDDIKILMVIGVLVYLGYKGADLVFNHKFQTTCVSISQSRNSCFIPIKLIDRVDTFSSRANRAYHEVIYQVKKFYRYIYGDLFDGIKFLYTYIVDFIYESKEKIGEFMESKYREHEEEQLQSPPLSPIHEN